LHVGGRSLQTILFEDGTDLIRSPSEVAGKLDFFVADLCDFGDCPLEVILHQIAHGIELDAHLLDSVFAGGPTEARGEQGCGGCSARYFQKITTVYGMKTHDRVSSSGSVGAEISSGELYPSPQENRCCAVFPE